MSAPDKDALILAARRVRQWLDDGCPSWGSPESDIRKLIESQIGVKSDPGMSAEDFGKALYERDRARVGAK
jgi:hypothetical protein